MDRKTVIGRVTLAVMGLFAYLILAITCYQNAWAEPLAQETQSNPAHIGFWFDTIQAGGDSSFLAILATTQALSSAAAARASEECRIDGDIDFSCASTRYGMILDYLAKANKANGGDGSHNSVANMFYTWCVKAGIDRKTPLAIVLAGFLDGLVDAYEQGT